MNWLPHNNHVESRDQEITGMNVSIHTISTTEGILIYTSIKDIREAKQRHRPVNAKTYIMRRWQHTKDEVQPCIESYWSSRHELAMIDGITMKGK